MKVVLKFSDMYGKVEFNEDEQSVTITPEFFSNSQRQTLALINVEGEGGLSTKELLQVSSKDGALTTMARVKPKAVKFDAAAKPEDKDKAK